MSQKRVLPSLVGASVLSGAIAGATYAVSASLLGAVARIDVWAVAMVSGVYLVLLVDSSHGSRLSAKATLTILSSAALLGALAPLAPVAIEALPSELSLALRKVNPFAPILMFALILVVLLPLAFRALSRRRPS